MSAALLAALGAAAPAGAAGWSAAGTQLRDGDRPAAWRGWWYPVHARRDGQPLDAAAVVAETHRLGLNLLALTVAEGPTLSDAAALLRAAAAVHLAVVVRPLPDDDPEAAARIARALADAPAPAAWVLSGPAPAALEAAFVVRASAAPVPPDEVDAEVLLSELPALYQGALSAGSWASQLVRQRTAWGLPGLVSIAASPPDRLVQDGLLQPAASHPDLYRETHLRPHSAAALAGEYLLLPEPAQVRLQVYAAIGRGARGILYDHAGHIAGGAADPASPFSSADRALEVAQLGQELGWFERFMSAGEPQPAPAMPDGVAGGLLRLNDEWLLLLWRNARLDTRTVAGGVVPAFDLDLKLAAPAGLRQFDLEPGGVTERPADLRPGGVRVAVPELDLTRAYLLSPRPQPELVAAVAQVLPATVDRAVALAAWRRRKAEYTIGRLAVSGHAAGASELLAGAYGEIYDAVQAQTYGYLSTALDLARAADRTVREAQGRAMAQALTEPATAEGERFRTTFASLPWLWQARERLPGGVVDLVPGTPRRLDWSGVSPGGSPLGWTALGGLDQTVTTLRVGVEDGGGRWLAWQPRGGDPGALYLPFTPSESLSLTARLRVDGRPRVARLILLAPGSYQPPVGGLVVSPDGTVSAVGGSASVPAGAGWQTLVLTVRERRLEVRWAGQLLGSGPVSGPVGAVVLAKRAGDDPVPLDLAEVVLTAAAP